MQKLVSKRKNYHIGLVNVSYEIISKFRTLRELDQEDSFKENDDIRFFEFTKIVEHLSDLYPISIECIKHFYNDLEFIRLDDGDCIITSYNGILDYKANTPEYQHHQHHQHHRR